ncbi:helix-turn-helix domain-containing protein [Erwinia sp. CPCC 100877]|nr:helix-turn-helix domain-containing protein [Erwinia sp. CPCC 100877]
MNTGETLKFIRKKRNLTQKEILPTHIDPSTYSRIEAQKRPIRINDLQEILNGLSVTSEEFFSLNELDMEQQQFKQLFYYCGRHLDNQSKKNKLLNYYNELKHTNSKNLKQLSNYIAIKNYFSQHWNEVEKLTAKETNYTFNLLVEKLFYFQYDYILLSNLITHFNAKQSDLLIDKAFPIELEEYRDSTTKKFAYNALLNLISIRLHERNYEKTFKYIKLAKQQDKTASNYSFRMNLKYLENLTNYLTKGETKYMKQIYNFIEIIEDIGDFDFAELVKEEVKNLTYNTNKDRNYRIALIKDTY